MEKVIASAKMMTGESPVFTKWIFPTLASLVFLGIALAALGIGIYAFRLGVS